MHGHTLIFVLEDIDGPAKYGGEYTEWPQQPLHANQQPWPKQQHKHLTWWNGAPVYDLDCGRRELGTVRIRCEPDSSEL